VEEVATPSPEFGKGLELEEDDEQGIWAGRPSKKQLLWAIRYHGVLERSKRKPASLQCLYAKNQEQKHRGKAQKYIDRSGSN